MDFVKNFELPEKLKLLEKKRMVETPGKENFFLPANCHS